MSRVVAGCLLLACAFPTVGVPLALWESAWWLRRRARRGEVHSEAEACARALGRPLVVVGAPDRGLTGAYPGGDVTIDIAESADPNWLRADVCEPLPFLDDSVVVFVSCVLEYVDDLDAALRELFRISGGCIFFVGVEPWTLTAYLYPGSKRTLDAELR